MKDDRSCDKRTRSNEKTAVCCDKGPRLNERRPYVLINRRPQVVMINSRHSVGCTPCRRLWTACLCTQLARPIQSANTRASISGYVALFVLDFQVRIKLLGNTSKHWYIREQWSFSTTAVSQRFFCLCFFFLFCLPTSNVITCEAAVL